MDQMTVEVTEEMRVVTEKARKRAREAQEIKAKMPPSEAQRFIISIKKDLKYLGKFN